MSGLSSDFKLTKLILLVGCPSYNIINSWKKYALIDKPSVQIPKTFNQHDTAEKAIKHLDINTLI